MIGQLHDNEIEEILLGHHLGRIACSEGDRPYIIPVNYFYDGETILIHSAFGKKIEMMRSNPQVCFQVDDIKSMSEWKSVIVFGRYQEIQDEQERYEAMDKFVKKMMHLKLSETAIPPERTERLHPRSDIELVIYQIIPTEKTGRFERGLH